MIPIQPPPPPGMIAVPAGEFFRGRDHSERPDETPRHRVRLSAFFIDRTLVTFADFRAFVDKTHFVSTSEKRGYGMVAYEGLPDWKWIKTPGATWRQPFGPKDKTFTYREDDPVIAVSWDDAVAYCAHFGKRLPTEAEWEYAARAGRGDVRFPWGDQAEHDGKLGLNFWQGKSHVKDEGRDGYRYVSSVKAFPPNAWGMYDPVGNVWQWTADWYSPTYYREVASKDGVQDPKGPADGSKRVTRGGSWWCSAKTCSGYGLFFRGKTAPQAIFNNKGFRCAKN